MNVKVTHFDNRGMNELDRLAAEQRDATARRFANEIAQRKIVNERSTEFKAGKTPDRSSLEEEVFRVHAAIRQVEIERKEVATKQARLTSKINSYDSLINERKNISAQIQDVEAQAIISEQTVDLTAQTDRMAEITIALSEFSNIDAVKVALKLVEKEKSNLDEHLAVLKKNLSDIEQKWVRAFHADKLERLREQLHCLHRVIADILAAESIGYFREYEIHGWSFVEQVSEGIPFQANVRPDWANSNRPSAFPGFAAATAALRDRLSSFEGINQ